MAGVLVEACMPEERDGEGRELDRGWARGKTEGLGEIARKAWRHGGDDRRPAQYEGHCEESRRGQRDGALQFELGEHVVDRAMGIGTKAGENVRHPQRVCELEWWNELELLRAEEAEEVVGVERAALVMDLAMIEY